MSVVERKNGRRKERPVLRWLAAGLVGLMVVNLAAQASFAGGGSAGVQATYGGNGGRDDDDDGGLGAEDIALIVVGGAAIAALALGVFGGGDDDDEATTTTTQNPPSGGAVSALPGGASVSEVRLVSQKLAVEAGTNCRFDLQARSKDDGKWYSVTGQPGASIGVQEGSSLLVRQSGTKNVFCAPLTAKAGSGQSVTVVGSYTPAGGAPITAQTAVSVQAL